MLQQRIMSEDPAERWRGMAAGADRRWLTSTRPTEAAPSRAGAAPALREQAADAARAPPGRARRRDRRARRDVRRRRRARAPDAWRRAAQVCKEQLGCDYLSFVAGIDWMPTPRGRRRGFGRHVHSRAAEGTDLRRRGQRRSLPGVRASSSRRGASSWRVILKTDVPDDDLHARVVGVGVSGRRLARARGVGDVRHRVRRPPELRHLYLPSEFEGHPLRKDYPLLAREVKPWPGLVDVEPMPGETATTTKPADDGGESA